MPPNSSIATPLPATSTAINTPTPQPPRGHKIARWVLGVTGGIMVALALGLLFIFTFAKDIGWKEAHTSNRQVIYEDASCDITAPKGGVISVRPHYQYTFTVNGVIYHTSDCSPTLKSVLYLPANPAIYFSDNRSPYILVLLFGIIGIIALVIARIFK